MQMEKNLLSKPKECFSYLTADGNISCDWNSHLDAGIGSLGYRPINGESILPQGIQ